MFLIIQVWENVRNKVDDVSKTIKEEAVKIGLDDSAKDVINVGIDAQHNIFDKIEMQTTLDIYIMLSIRRSNI